MPKQAVPISFAGGLDRKTDPFQVSPGKFLSLVNSVFTTGGRLTKRNGFGSLANLPFASQYLTTLNGDLTAVGAQIQAYSSESEAWTSIGNFYPCNLSTLSVVRSNTNQSQVDSAIAPSGLLCMAWTDQTPTSLATSQFKYAVYDSVTGQQLLAPVVIANADTTFGAPRVFVLGNYFIIAFVTNISTVNNLKYIAVNISSLVSSAEAVITTSITPAAGVSWDADVMNGYLYFAWNGASTSGLKMNRLSSTLALSATVNPDASHTSTQVSVCVDSTAQVVYATYYSSSSTNGYTVAVSSILALLANFPVKSITSTVVANLATCVAVSGTLSIFLEVTNAYSYDSAILSNFINLVTVLQSTGVASGQSGVVRSVGLASKAFVIAGIPYFLSAYTSPFQPTYFLINGNNGNVIAELAYENGGGYLTNGLPSVSVSGQVASVAYLIKDFIQAMSNANAAGTTTVGGIYSQTGISQATFTIGSSATITTAEIGKNLNITGGFAWGYDGTQATEQGFFLWPDSIEATIATTGGHLIAQKYYYQVIYSWSDNRGNIFRSAGSIPLLVDLTSSMTSTNAVTITGPYLRLTYKPNVKVEIYRWSAEHENFYQLTTIAKPLINLTASDSWSFVDNTTAGDDANIVGNELLYTTGGVVEDIGGPGFVSTFTFDDRLWGITSEDRDLLWFSKQVIEGTPVEFSDLLTQYVAPSIGAQGNTGELTCGAQMDDKLVLFRETGLLYINGTGPDNTGSNSQYSQPTFITSMVGCSNQSSIVFQPEGLMFEFASEAGNQIWLLGRDLSTKYIGAAVEGFTLNTSVTSAIAIPGTNQVRFNFANGSTVMYDYFYGEWGEFTLNAVSSTLYQGLHTFIDARGAVFQETPNLYLDGSHPVLMAFTTGWIGIGGLRGYERLHEFSFLGTYYSPHKLVVSVAFDYGSISQSSTWSPPNFSPAYGGAPFYGSGPYGGPSNIEQFRVFAKRQKCKAFQISVQEVYDPSFGVAAGQGLSLSGLNMLVTVKKGWSPISGRNSIG